MNLLEAFKAFLFSQDNKPSKVTVKNYLSDINHFVRWYENKFQLPFSASQVKRETIEDYKAKSAESFSASSVERHLSSLRKFFYFLKLEGQISIDPFKNQLDEAQIKDPWHLKDFKSFLYIYNASHLTIKNYVIDIKQFLSWAEQVTGANKAFDLKDANILNHISPKLVGEYKQRLLNQAQFSPATINRKLSSLRKYVSWAQETNLIQQFSFDTGNFTQEKPNTEVFIPEIVKPKVFEPEFIKPYSKFPPLRLFQKVTKGIILGLDATLITQLVSLIEKSEYVLWKTKGQPIFEKAKGLRLPKSFTHEHILGIKNLPKELYAPLEVSTKHFPWHKKAIFTLRYQRPNWYKTYHSYAITHYFHFAVLIIFLAGLALGFYNAFGPNNQTPTFAALPTAPPRVLSFQGRLTDNNDNPITSNTNLRFAIYNDLTASGAALLWQEVDNVVPDPDGIFNVILGNNTTIPSTLFSENAALWLGVTVKATPELTPRQQLATVAYATNSETLQGLVPITAVGAPTENVVLALDSSGNLSIGGSADPVFQATGGPFRLSGQTLLLTSNAGSNGNVQIAPDGTGKVDLTKPLINTSISNNITTARGAVEVNDLFAILATSSGQSALTINQTGGGPIISASASGVAKFTVDNAGNIDAAGNGAISGTLTLSSSSPLAFTGTTPITITQTNGSTINWTDGTNNLLQIIDNGTNGILNVTGNYQINGANGASVSNACVNSTGGIITSAGTCPASAPAYDLYWNQTSGTLYPNNSTVDFLIGGQATSSAKFAITGVSNPNNQVIATLSGNLIVMPNNGFGGRVGIGTSNPAAFFHVASTANQALFRVDDDGIGDTTPFLIDADGNVAIGQTATNDILNLTKTQDANTRVIITNASGGTAATAQFLANNASATVGFGVGGTAYTTIPILQSRGFINAESGANGIVLNNQGANPILFATSNTERARFDATGNFGVGTTSPLATLDVRGGSGTLGVASVSGKTSFAALVANNDGVGDLFTASSSSQARFSIKGNGQIIANAYQTCTLKTDSTGLFTCGTDNTGGGSGFESPFRELSGTIIPLNSTLDFLIGGQATTSAKFALINIAGTRGTQTASLSGSLVLDSSTASIQTTNNQLLTIGGDKTGNITFTPNNTQTLVVSPNRLSLTGATTVDSTGALSLNTVNNQTITTGTGLVTTGGDLQINGNDIQDSGAAIRITLGATTTLTNTTTTLSGTTTLTASSLATIDAAASLSLDSTTLTLGNGSSATVQTTTGGLTLDSGSNTLTIAASDTTLTATGIATVSLGTSATINAGATALNLQADGAIDVNIAGGQSTTGCTIFNATGNLACSGNISGAATGIQGYWQRTAGALSPTNITDDVLIGATASNAAKIGFINIAGGTPTASISATTTGLVLGGDGTIQTIRSGLLTLGGNTTGGILLSSDFNSGVFIGQQGTLAPLSITGGIGANAALIVNQLNSADILTASASGTTRFTISNVGAIGLTSGYGSASQCLTSNGSGTAASWGTCGSGGDSFWGQNLGLLYPANSTVDLAIGGTASSSAKFLFANVNSGQPTLKLFNSASTQSLNLFHNGTDGNITASTGTINIGAGGGTLFLETDIVNDTTNFSGAIKINDKLLVQHLENGIALAVFDNTGTGDILTASASGVPKFTIGNTGTLTSAAYTNAGGILYTSATGLIGQTAIGTSAQCLVGGTIPSFGSCLFSDPYWNQLNGSLFPNNSTVDLLVGGQATTSAKFALININGARGTQTASLSGSLTLDAVATIQTTRDQGLTIGGNTTGDISFMPDNGAGGIGINKNPGDASLDIQSGGAFVDILRLNTSSGTQAYSIDASGRFVFNPTTQYAGTTIDFGGGLASSGGGSNFFLINVDSGNSGNLFNVQDEGVSLFVVADGGKIGVNSSSPLSTFDIRYATQTGANGGTLSVASISGRTSFATLVANNDGVGDLFTASASGAPRFRITNQGDLLPGTDNTQSIGSSPSARWKDLFLGGGSLHIQCKTTDAGCPASQGLDYSLGINSSGTFGIGANLNSGSTPAFNITQGGNIGIGTTVPHALLHVSGGNTGGNAALIVNQTGNSANDIIAASSSGTTQFRLSNGGGVYTRSYNDLDNTNYFLDPAATATSLNVAGAIVLNGGTTGAAPTPQINFATPYYDNAGNPSISHINLFNSQYGIGISGSQFNLISDDAFAFYDDTDLTTPVMFIDGSAKNVGIGTTGPSRQLHIYGAGQAVAALTDAGNTGGTLYIQDSGTAPNNGGAVIFGASQGFFAGIKGLIQDGTTNTKGHMVFLTRNAIADTALTERMRINSDGNVGIGKTTPVSKLDVGGGAANWNETTPGLTTGSIHLDPENATDHFGSAITWGASDNGTGENAQAGIYVRSDGTYGTKMYFATTNLYTSGSQTRMYISDDGDVGIGKTTPTAKLDVNGTASASAVRSGGAVNSIEHSSSFISSAPNNGYGILAHRISGDLNHVFRIAGWGGLMWGAGGSTTLDTHLERCGVACLSIDNASTGGAGKLLINDNGSAAGTNLLQVGDDAFFTDVDVANTIGLYGATNNAIATLRLGSGGSDIFGSGGFIGIGATPDVKFLVNGGDAQAIKAKGGSVGAANITYMGFYDSGNTRKGYVGDGSAGNSDIQLISDAGGIVLTVSTTANTTALCHAGTTGNHLVTDCNGSATDIAEFYPGTSDMEPGDLVALVPNSDAHFKYMVVKTENPYDPDIIGVVSTIPTGPNGSAMGEATIPDSQNPQAIGLSGRVSIKVSLENGPIKINDYLTSSSVPGVAMKATKTSRVIGRALEDYDGSLQVSTGVRDQEFYRIDSNITTNKTPQDPPVGIGKILMFTNPAWYDPDVYLTSTGDLNLVDQTVLSASQSAFTIPHYFTLEDALGNPIDRIGAFKEIAVGNIKAGFVQAQQISTNALSVTTENIRINGLGIRDYIASIVTDVLNSTNNNLISPIASADQIHTNLISPLDETSNISLDLTDSKITIRNGKNASSSAVAVIDNFGNASFSGSLRVGNDASVSGTLRASRIIADNIEGLNINASTVSANYITNVTNIYSSTPAAFPTLGVSQSGSSSGSSFFGDLFANNNFLNIATFSSSLAYVENLNAATAAFSQGLNVYGSTSLADTSIVGQLAINGSMILSDNSINVLGNDLNLQPLRQGGLSIMAGLIYIDTNGNVKIEGDTTINGTLYANVISPLPGQDLSIKLGTSSALQNGNLTIKNATGSSILTLNQFGDLIASGTATFAKLKLGNLVSQVQAVSSTEINATGSAGTAFINPYKTEMTINNTQVTKDSLIYITPTSNTNNQVLFLLRQIPGKSFTVGMPNTTNTQIPFNWIIVN